MKYEWLDDYCTSKTGAHMDYKEEWEATRYMINGKMFAMRGGDKEGKEIITIKLEPQHGELLREEYKDIVPGYYMNKQHWNSVYIDGEVPDDVVKDMLDKAHALIFNSLSKKAQKDIIDDAQK